MAPSITETLYALGLGDRVVGVSRFCEYPPEVKGKPIIGGYYDPSFEAILALRPDLTIMLEDHAQSLPGFAKLGLPALVVCHKTVDNIIDSFRLIGQACGRPAGGAQMAEQYERRLARIRAKTRDLPRPTVLFVLDRTLGLKRIADVYVAGDDGYFDAIIELAGGRNAYGTRGVRNPVVSPEGILWLDPEVIIDVVRGSDERSDRGEILADWNELHHAKAVRRGRVFLFNQSFAYVPGPRFIELTEHLARVLHPEVKCDE
jgi:iron complex transport system substrate-binding protein